MGEENFFELQDLRVRVAEKEILKGVNLKIGKGEIHAIFGPNGSGKTTLLNAIMGFGGYQVEGKILFRGKDISRLPVNERANLGIGMSFQRPPAIRGVKLRNLILNSARRNGDSLLEYARRFLEAKRGNN